MTEINFYQIDDVITKSLAPLLMKVMEDKKKALIFCTNAAKFKEIDDSLWTYGKYRFIPHLTASDKEIAAEFSWERQPILLNNKEENLNKADCLVMIDEVSQDFMLNFARVFYFYDEVDAGLAKALAKKFEGVVKKVSSYKKEDGKWVANKL